MGGTARTGTANLFDGAQHTAPSEYSSRSGTKIDTLQIHHATLLSLSALISLMQPGGRTVSANGAMGNDGTLIEVVPVPYRAFTSASTYDRRCLTVECCNTSLAPSWGISAATRTRLAQLAVDMFRAGLLGGLSRAYIIGHNEVPGSYATACPGPDMHLDAIVAEANAIYHGAATAALVGSTIRNGDTEMRYFWAPNRGGFTDTTNDGPLYPSTAEEAEALSFAYSGVDVSNRTWDVLRQASLNRQDAAGRARDNTINAAINAAIDEAIGDGEVEVTINAQEIAKAVRAEFGKNPLK